MTMPGVRAGTSCDVLAELPALDVLAQARIQVEVVTLTDGAAATNAGAAHETPFVATIATDPVSAKACVWVDTMLGNIKNRSGSVC